ncbi:MULTISPECIES: ABC-type transport auxiliary lipoprotein family protein [unclassified Janthinobacterium]|uniref:ABC-type transport auxiliary lipoprotein family protein n=1 Tax=unclassified Janthinobacterium TaxID=2610881 RepID=UPI00034A5AA7|nr:MULTISPECIES: ABC-type transport auxiliary lipoprotein family protein [unclassified Janthinobacterium]MEC5163478.1 cholesterol transport system auxiliary component [Janthinobacterium sp. CG_S6]
MTTTPTRRLATLALALAAATLGGCASAPPTTTLYDFGPPPGAAAPADANGAAASALVVADVTGPSWLDSQRMYYRLLYADAQQSRPYAHNRWNSPPLQLLGARLKSRIAQSGVKVLATTDAAAGAGLLRVEVDDFSHTFDSQSRSSGRLTLRASLFRNHRLVDQRTFSRDSAAASADALGGAKALAAASDAVAADIIAWLAALPLRKE